MPSTRRRRNPVFATWRGIPAPTVASGRLSRHTAATILTEPGTMANEPITTELYLMTPIITEAVPFLPLFEAVLAAARPASVMIRIAARDEQDAKRIARPLVMAAQKHEAAALLEGFASIIAKVGADGIHLTDGRKGLAEAIADFRPDRIVGAGMLRTKHDAMTVAESGVDYVMFGEPSADGRTPPLPVVEERARWWAEVFETPCVACAPDLQAVPLLADTGCEFVAVAGAIWDHDAGAAVAARIARDFLAQRRAA